MTEQSKPKCGPTEQSAGQRRAINSTADGTVGALAPGQRWSGQRKRDVVLRILRGEPLEALSRELGIETYRLERWHRKALSGIEASLREREGDPVKTELDAALKRVGELTMEVELLKLRVGRPGPFAKRRSGR
jgi:hypothetical protein